MLLWEIKEKNSKNVTLLKQEDGKSTSGWIEWTQEQQKKSTTFSFPRLWSPYIAFLYCIACLKLPKVTQECLKLKLRINFIYVHFLISERESWFLATTRWVWQKLFFYVGELGITLPMHPATGWEMYPHRKKLKRSHVNTLTREPYQSQI